MYSRPLSSMFLFNFRENVSVHHYRLHAHVYSNQSQSLIDIADVANVFCDQNRNRTVSYSCVLCAYIGDQQYVWNHHNQLLCRNQMKSEKKKRNRKRVTKSGAVELFSLLFCCCTMHVWDAQATHTNYEYPS